MALPRPVMTQSSTPPHKYKVLQAYNPMQGGQAEGPHLVLAAFISHNKKNNKK